ncbi:amino acid adenylation domain-containing protein, partial [Embleya sp. NPDC005575]|uniref:amino acid adenylation domain-containing protein n=1 Tax=Embleya sp. NPDC005575 TaxID=3156892 RepID=UPI0033AB57B4
MTTNPMVAFPATAGAAPEGLSPAEIRIAAIWQAVLDIDQAAESAFPERDFFELGGTDAGATEMAERVEAEFGTAFRITSIPPPLTVRAISAHLAEQAFLRARRLFEEGAEFDGLIPTEWGAPEESAMQAVVRDGGPLPLSFAQQRLWFLDQLEPGRAKYLIPLGLRVCGPLDVTALETALTALVARHESLRTRFVADDDGNPGQLVDEPQPVVITLRDLRDLDDARERSEAARRMVDTDAFHPVDLAVGPMLRCILIRLADEEYIVAITVHHIVFDGWSAGILARELPELYTAVVTDRSAELSAPAVQYADFAVWQREWLTGEVLDGQLGYWRERLAHLEPLELPTDRRRPARRSGAGEAITFAVPAELAEQARQAATANGASLFMTLLAVFQVLLSKYSGQEDIAVGTPIAGRNRAEIEDMIGFFVNTLVMRTDLAGDPTFTELLGRVRDTALGAYDHQDLPFERLVEELAPERDLSRNPLFQTMFVLQNVPENHAWALPGLTVEPIGVEAQDAKFDFTCYLTEAADGGLDGMIVYSTELFDEATMVRLAGHFQTLLAEVTGHPDRRLSAADPLTPAERRQILVEWNGDTTEPTDPTPVHRLFEAQAAARPEALAIACGAGTLTYRQLNERANRLAHHLRAHGVGPDAPVAVCLDRGPEMICALLGILKAGAAYVPLDPDYPTERLTYMIEDSDTPLIVTQTTHTPRLPEHTPRILLDHHWWTDTAEDSAGNPMDPVGNPTRSVGPSDLAYTIYTSGSTGRPKGVQIEHGALAARMSETRRELGLTHDDRLLQFASIAFDSSVGQIFAPLTCGAALILREDEWDPTTLAALLRDSRATIAWLTPSAFAALIAQADGPEALGDSLRLVRLGGEALQHEQIRQWFAHSTVPLLNGYGPTEAAQEATTARIERTPEFVPIGRPVANTEVFVVDRHGLPVPVGIAGEIRIGCAGLARGYLNRSDLTREKFTEFEAAGRTRRVYRTGDLAKWHPDGTLEFVGRIDNQVKLRGYRIELGEIEATLLDHPGLTAATVVVREDVPGDKRLIAYVVPTGAVAHEPAGTTPTGELRAHLRRHLPEYMVPAGFVVLDRLPLTPNGKVDRKALPAPDLQRPDLEAAYTAPRTPAEQAVTAIWSDVLGVDTIGIHDNFFELGGHSLLATRVTSRLRKALGVDVPVRTLFSAPTPAELARAVVGMDTDETNRLAPITRDGSPLPLSFAQQRLWFLDQLEPGRAEYLISFALRLTGPFDPTALATAGAALIGRHEVLRTRFAPDDRGLPGQLVSEPGPFIIDTRDLRHIEHRDSREDAARRILDTDGLEPIDLGSGMLLRTLLVRLADDEHILAITVHHIAFDGWSVAVLARELTELYTSAVGAGSAELPVLPMQYADYAVWQREWLTGDVLERQLAHWRATLADLEPLELPTDHRRPAERTGAGEVVTFGVPAAIADRVKAIGAGEGASLFMTLLAVFQVLLSKYSGQEDIAVGTPIAG